MPIAVFYVIALALPVLIAVVTAALVRSAWAAGRPASTRPKLLLALWILVSLLAIGVGGLASLLISIARATTPDRAQHARAAMIVLAFLLVQVTMGVALRRALRRSS